ncbi:hypothetical protein [Corallococcus exiguus]|uniref:hypothetical protein n=1 Tax=Corallococcus exiguus TaxID=83462 RepID=UPI0011C3AD12|nr:hypothetical protein [Corallococcus exiguus]NPD29679.1 hypothetical protein [Corallococcus exiguus]
MPMQNDSGGGFEQSHAYRKGNLSYIKTIIVLAAGGWWEALAGRPAAGQTGVTLQIALQVWHALDPIRFPSLELDDYTIVNAVEDVHYKRKTGRTEGTQAEIRTERNLHRLRRILADYEYIAALGVSARTAVESAGFEASYAGCHPSMQALNRMYTSTEETAAARRVERVAQWARDVMA